MRTVASSQTTQPGPRHIAVKLLLLLTTAGSDVLAKKTPFTVSPNKRNIVFRNNPKDAFEFVSDTAWNIVQELSRDQIEEYLDIRFSQGFAMVQFIGAGHDWRPQRHYGWRPVDDGGFSKPKVIRGTDND